MNESIERMREGGDGEGISKIYQILCSIKQSMALLLSSPFCPWHIDWLLKHSICCSRNNRNGWEVAVAATFAPKEHLLPYVIRVALFCQCRRRYCFFESNTLPYHCWTADFQAIKSARRIQKQTLYLRTYMQAHVGISMRFDSIVLMRASHVLFVSVNFWPLSIILHTANLAHVNFIGTDIHKYTQWERGHPKKCWTHCRMPIEWMKKKRE